MARRRITLTELAKMVGITLANLSNIKTNKARAIRFSTLDAICRELECQPGDLLEHFHVNQVPKDKQLTGMTTSNDQPHHSDSGLPGDYY
jgi:putative transcriptional regulator